MSPTHITFGLHAQKHITLDEFKTAIDGLHRHSTQFYPRFKAILRRLPREDRLDACLYAYDNSKGAYPHYGILMQAVFALRHARVNDKNAVLRDLEFRAPFETPFKSALTRRVNAIN